MTSLINFLFNFIIFSLIQTIKFFTHFYLKFILQTNHTLDSTNAAVLIT